MAMLSKAVLATAVISTGLLSSTGMAMAGGNDGADGAHGHSSRTHSHGDETRSRDSGDTYQRGIVNSGDISPNTSPDLCGNDLQNNIGGIQVPFNEISGALGLLSKSDHGSTSPGSTRTCSSPASS